MSLLHIPASVPLTGVDAACAEPNRSLHDTPAWLGASPHAKHGGAPGKERGMEAGTDGALKCVGHVRIRQRP